MPSANKRANNSHKFVTANHQPRQKAAQRKLLAEARQEVYNELTLEQKIKMLPPEPLAKKVRAKLMAQLTKKNNGGAAEKIVETK
jgi:hypothetical protein